MSNLMAWLTLKLGIWYYNLLLTPQERVENKAALAVWEQERAINSHYMMMHHHNNHCRKDSQ